MSLFHKIVDATDDLHNALPFAESDQQRDELRAGIANNDQVFGEAWDSYSRLLPPHTDLAAIRQPSTIEVLTALAMHEPLVFGRGTPS
jgi:hypothetical protein